MLIILAVLFKYRLVTSVPYILVDNSLISPHKISVMNIINHSSYIKNIIVISIMNKYYKPFTLSF